MPICLPRKRARPSSSSFCKSCPATTTAPASGRSSPVIAISKVDLPEPDGPSRATASPRPILRSICRRIWTRAAPRPSDKLTPESEMALVMEGSSEMSFMMPAAVRPSYGWRHALVQIAVAAACSLTLAAATATAKADSAPPIKIVALGDSLTAGYGLPDSDGFVPRLQAALTAKGIAATVQNAGVSGDTAADGLARLDWSVPEGTDAVILELGANDMLRGFKPEVTRDALDTILRRLTE